MKTITQFSAALLAAAILLSLQSCATLTGFNTGRTVGKDQGEMGLSLNFANVPEFQESESAGEVLRNIAIPLVELGGRYGVAENVDIGLRVNTALNFLVDTKVQLIGGQDGPFALATGAGLGAFGVVSGAGMLLNFQVPLYTSYHPSETFALYLSPRYIGQFGTNFQESSGMLNYLGANTGFETGRRVRFGLDVGYYQLSNKTESLNSSILQIGIGVKFRFGAGSDSAF
jgi:hypothetical protein